MTIPSVVPLSLFLAVVACWFLFAAVAGRVARALRENGVRFAAAEYERGRAAGFDEYAAQIRDLNAAVCWRDADTGALRAHFPDGVEPEEMRAWAAQFENPAILARQEAALDRLLAGAKVH